MSDNNTARNLERLVIHARTIAGVVGSDLMVRSLAQCVARALDDLAGYVQQHQEEEARERAELWAAINRQGKTTLDLQTAVEHLRPVVNLQRDALVSLTARTAAVENATQRKAT